ncbi:MAG: chemotaxis protein CheD [Deltaproteobacteria bacterium]|nr:chemotaxis protein CheD [Deltaproteobacteria bacterium]
MIFAQSGQHMITTVLGSCISVCLWDAALHFGGMNHYLLPFWNGDGLQTPKYGNVAIPMLVEKMISLGSSRGNLRAKVFGGANILENSSGLLNIGARNISFAETALIENRIMVLGKDIGGTAGRKVMFLTSTGEVFVKKVVKGQG